MVRSRHVTSIKRVFFRLDVCCKDTRVSHHAYNKCVHGGMPMHGIMNDAHVCHGVSRVLGEKFLDTAPLCPRRPAFRTTQPARCGVLSLYPRFEDIARTHHRATPQQSPCTHGCEQLCAGICHPVVWCSEPTQIPPAVVQVRALAVHVLCARPFPCTPQAPL